ncbi:cytochrome P450 71AU50-like [Magnolia sinica]|uniref:cytochrome P450 71AU50-like n=1 Tax=Magnolia sinica TaxID=86752 RepID=UPI002657FF09|nr:cytochrome P450 71AU50-like [Magnolia sinica]
MYSWAPLLFLVLAVVWSLVHLLRSIRVGSKDRLPPGPPGLPILGNLHMLGDLPHRTLHTLAQRYGPIMYMRLGLVPTVVVSSPQAAQQFLKAHDLIFASRPYLQAVKYIAYDQRGLAFSTYGPYWRNVRKLCTLELLSNLKIESFKPMRREEVGLLVRSIKCAAEAHDVVDLSAKVASLTTDMTCRMVLGKKYMGEKLDNRGFKAVIQEIMWLSATFNVADYIPWLRVLDLKGLTRRMKSVSKVFDDFFEKIIDEHDKSKEMGHDRDFVDVLLSLMKSEMDGDFRVDRTNTKAILLEMLAAAIDTSATAIEWALSELLKHPQVMKKVQDELRTVVGFDQMVEESDLPKLEYLDMVVKESLRLHPVAPFLIPRESMEDCTINGFHIPKKCRVIINAWAIGRDPTSWSNADQFSPERFVGSSIDVRGRDFQLIPFGSGRRVCPGMQLGLTVVRLVVAQLVHCFDWELPDGSSPGDLDMSETFSLVVPRANHLLAIPTKRLNSDLL